jgi:hypothetical protein
LNDHFELPSLEQIEQMEKQWSEAIQALEISNDSVKCQTCGIAVPLLKRLTTKPNSIRTEALQNRIRWMEKNYSRDISRGNSSVLNINDLKNMKRELAELLEKEAKADKLRSLPLYSCRATHWKHVCSNCFEKRYRYHYRYRSSGSGSG